ncbi:MAG: D-inositol-3-phosphate glycosyltransferase [Candidatus Nanopelagicales bacterium]
MVKKSKVKRVAVLSVHTSPLDQPGTGDAGGLNVYVVETAKRLAKRGTQVDIFTRRTASTPDHQVELFPGVNVKHVTAGPFEGLNKNSLPAQLCALTAGVLREEAFKPEGWYDLIHSHYWLSGQVGWVASERWNVPLVHTMHTMARVKNLSLAAGDAPEPKEREIGEQQVVKAAQKLVANTQQEASELINLYGANPNQVSVVNPGVDLDTFHPADQVEARSALGLNPDAFVLTFVGRVQPLKAPDLLLLAVSEMLKVKPELASKLQIVICGGLSGSGFDKPTQLIDLAKSLKLEKITKFLTPMSRQNLAKVYQASNLVVVPSYSESFGLVAIEAQAAGVPVVAAKVGGLKTVVDHEQSGILVEDHNPLTWAKELIKLIESPRQLSSLSQGALNKAKAFSWDRSVEQLLDIYQTTLEKQNPSPVRISAV